MNGKAIRDKTFEATQWLNNYLVGDKENLLLIKTWMIFCSGIMDIMVVTLFVNWAYVGRNLRLALTFLSFYFFRTTLQNFFTMEKDPEFYFEFPGFPSMVIAYGSTNDFFYSGHVGMCVMCFCEFNRMSERMQDP
jgi:hypothetical protein